MKLPFDEAGTPWTQLVLLMQADDSIAEPTSAAGKSAIRAILNPHEEGL